MKFLGVAEFRGLEKKQSSKGNPYYQLIFEDVENGEQLRVYSRYEKSGSYSVGVDQLAKGAVYNLAFNYHYDYGRWQLDLLDIREHKDSK